MARYIDADTLIINLKKLEKEYLYSEQDKDKYDIVYGALTGVRQAITYTKAEPTADVVLKSEWISVEDKLPEKEEIVLCCLGLVQNVYTYKGDNIWEDSYGYYQKDEPITHWMLLPEPPKGE